MIHLKLWIEVGMKLSLGWESLCAFVPEAGELNVRERERERDGNSGSPPHLYIVRISDAFILLFFLFLCSVLIIGGWRTCLKTKVTLFPSALRERGQGWHNWQQIPERRRGTEALSGG